MSVHLESNKEFNVCLQGALLDTGNQGCRALAFSLIKLIVDLKPNCRISLLYSSREGGALVLRIAGKTVKVNIVNCRLSLRSRKSEHLLWILFLACIQRIMKTESLRRRIIKSNKWLSTLNEANFVGEIRGGDSFSDLYGLRRFIFGITPSIIAILMRKELVLLPQTYGPFNSKLAKYIARYVIKKAVRLYSRDKNSIEVVYRLIGDRGAYKRVEFCPDVAFVLESTLPKKLNIQPRLDSNIHIPLIGVNISFLLYVRSRASNNEFGLRFSYREFILLLLRRLIEQTDAHILLVPHVTAPGIETGEVGISREVLAAMKQWYRSRLHIVAQQYDQSEIKGIIGLCDFFIGSRMHACIAALSQGIPAIGLAYSDKFKGVFQSVGVEHCAIDMRENNPEAIIDEIEEIFEQRNTISKDLMRSISVVKKNITDVFEDMLRVQKT
jgi:colanic acid/amylovoran biosynthesis protein